LFQIPLKTKLIFQAFILLLLLSSCDLDKEIEVVLPPFKKELVVECYVEREMPIKVLVTETDPYFDTLRFPFVNDAEIQLKRGLVLDSIPLSPYLDFASRKFYNYGQTWANSDTTQPLELTVKSKDGRYLTGSTQFLPLPDIDTVEVRYSSENDSLAGILVWINDFQNQSNFYRVIMNLDSLTGAPAVDFTFTDNGLDGNKFPVGTSFRFEKGKTMLVRLYHVEQQYYNYLRAMEAAARANGNPFAQPATVYSPMKGGGFGIFTTLNYRTIKLKL